MVSGAKKGGVDGDYAMGKTWAKQTGAVSVTQVFEMGKHLEVAERVHAPFLVASGAEAIGLTKEDLEKLAADANELMEL